MVGAPHSSSKETVVSTTTPPSTSSGQTLKREFTFGSAFAFAFAFISPIVALYGIYGLAISAAGPSFWWGFFIVFAGQFLVALVFATLVSRWPLEGSVYQWTNRLLGSGYGWFAGWFYIWTLVIAMATVALGAAGFIANIIGMQGASGTQLALIAFIVLILGTVINLLGRSVLKMFMAASIVAEIIGSIGLGVWLLIAHREHDFSVMFEGGANLEAGESYLSIGGPFLLAIMFIAFSFVGFESAGSIAEEVHEPKKNLPKAVLISIGFIAFIVMFSSLAVILATPENAESLPGYDDDPVYAVLTAQLGIGLALPIQVLFAIGFIASFLALQTSASRLIWAKARDGALPFSGTLVTLTKKQRQPVGALLVTTVIGTLLFLLSNVAENLYTMMVNFTSGGFYLSFLFPVAAFAITVLRRNWKPGRFSLGKWTTPIAVIALVWLVLQLINISWPREVNGNVWLDWSVIIGVVALTIIGSAIYFTIRGRIKNVETSVIDLNSAEAEDAVVGSTER